MKIRQILRLLESVQMLNADPEDIVEDIFNAKIETGEDLGEDEDEARENVIWEIQDAQRMLKQYVKGGEIAIHRAISVPPGWVEALKPGVDLGEYWSYEFDGAAVYNGDRKQTTLIVSGRTSVKSVEWPITIAVQVAGEREIRVAADEPIVIDRIVTKATGKKPVPVRQDLWGQTFRA